MHSVCMICEETIFDICNVMTDVFTVEIQSNFVDPRAMELAMDHDKVWPKLLFRCV